MTITETILYTAALIILGWLMLTPSSNEGFGTIFKAFGC